MVSTQFNSIQLYKVILLDNVYMLNKKKLKFEVPGESINIRYKYQLRKSFTHLSRDGFSRGDESQRAFQ